MFENSTTLQSLQHWHTCLRLSYVYVDKNVLCHPCPQLEIFFFQPKFVQFWPFSPAHLLIPLAFRSSSSMCHLVTSQRSCKWTTVFAVWGTSVRSPSIFLGCHHFRYRANSQGDTSNGIMGGSQTGINRSFEIFLTNPVHNLKNFGKW